ncbi:MFS transporter [Clostridium sp. MT-14]|jgi:sugar phosphate permease|uniref:MFS transporter n=1 Tax=Clostridium aromativorans TaxID=2836848 RepID=A0ABS8N919_9CLOT|nr:MULTISPECIES: MFS transporter [Clostridium]KAA8674710.1 MFS transporter [Clostridium sp. HV4-5-A1G]MCC9295649.1 MFS transporter [Clostridium aromativorans]CAB1249997.1 Transporter protein [Clostridiaceae bacterium BL-3]
MSSEIGNKRWFIAFMMVFVYAAMYLGRSSLSYVGPVLMKQFGWNATQFGLASTAFFIGYGLTMLPSGPLADKFGTTRVLIFGVLFWSVFVFLTPFVASLGMIIIVRALTGVGQGTVLPSNGTLMSRWMPQKEVGLAQGIVMIGTPLGIALTMLTAPFIMASFGWKSVFWIFALIGPIWTFVWLKFGKDRPEDDHRLSKAELEYIKSGQVNKEITGDAAKVVAKDIYSTPSVWIVALSYFASNYLFFMFMTWLPTYFAIGRGFSMKTAGLLLVAPYIVAMFCYPLGGKLADSFAKKLGDNVGRKMFEVIGLAGAAILLVLSSLSTNIIVAVIYLSISNGLLSITQAPFFSTAVIYSPKNAGMISGLYGFFGTAAGLIAPIVTGIIVDSAGYNNALFVGAAVAVVGAVIMLFAKIKPVEAKKAKFKGPVSI